MDEGNSNPTMNKLYYTLIGFLILSNIGILFYYESGIEAQEEITIDDLVQYDVTIPLDSNYRIVEARENAKGCVILFNTTYRDTNERVLTFTCDPLPKDTRTHPFTELIERVDQIEERVDTLERR